MKHTKEYINSLDTESKRELFFSLLDSPKLKAEHSIMTTRMSDGRLSISFLGYQPQIANTVEELILLPFGVGYRDMEWDKTCGRTFYYCKFPKF